MRLFKRPFWEERLMCMRPSFTGPGSLLGCLNQFLTPDVWRQAQAVRGAPRKKSRWNVHRLTFVLLAITWCTGDSVPECFETARAWYVACYQCRKRPGTACPGFLKALVGLPLPVLRLLAAGVRHRIFTLFADRLLYRGFHPFGCDGSRKECPRTVELEQRLGEAGKKDSAPTLWMTTIVHLRYGLLWAWRLGKGTASEQFHLIHLLTTLPAQSLLVTDAGYIGYELFVAMVTAHVHYLIRMSSRATVYTEDRQPLRKWRQGLVWYWPQWARDKGLPPIQARLLRVACKNADVWLAVQSLLAHASWELCAHGQPEEMRVSARQVLVLIRQDIILQVGMYLGPRQRQTYVARLRRAVQRERRRRSPKACRAWPRRKPHKAPKPPKIRRMTDKLKTRADKIFRASWTQN